MMTNIWQKRWFQLVPKNFWPAYFIFYLSVCLLVCVCSTTKKAGRWTNLHSTQLTPRVISPEIMERFTWNFGKTNVFPLGTCRFNARFFIVLNPNMVNNSLFLLRARTSVAPGCPLRVVSREETHQTGQRPENHENVNHENVICRSVGESAILWLSGLARVDAHRADPSAKTSRLM